MTDCVLTAFEKYAKFLNETTNLSEDRRLFRWLKRLTHGTDKVSTDGAYVPMIVSALADMYGLKVCAQVFLMTKEVAMQHAARNGLDLIEDSRFADEVDAITLAPAIYLDVSSQHAFFAEEVPHTGLIVMAIKLSKE